MSSTKFIVEDIKIDENNTFSGKIWKSETHYRAIKGKFVVEFNAGQPIIKIPVSWIYNISSPNLIDLDDLTQKVLAEYNHNWFTDNAFLNRGD